jgi:hypothetical protein
MDNNSSNNLDTIAICKRIEVDPGNGDLYIVFKIINERFKQEVRECWTDDIELYILGKGLVKK